ncbi:MAG TPA: hypothetical protein VF221_14840, partial [Chloroflexota bacterium]
CTWTCRPSTEQEGTLHWHDEPYAPFFDRSCRSFAHLCLGDPSRDSTGAHELGINRVHRAPMRQGIIPTVSIVDGTIEQAAPEVEQIIDDARQYRMLHTGSETPRPA